MKLRGRLSDKCTERPQNVHVSWCQKYQCAYLICPSGPLFICFVLYKQFLSYGPIVRKVHKVALKTCAGEKHPYAYSTHTWDPNFHPFCSMMSFQFMEQLWEKCTEGPQNDLDMFKSTHMHTSYTPEGQSFIHFNLQWPVFVLQPNF